MRSSSVKKIAFGGVCAALAVVIMCLLGFLGIATYVCPMLCIILCGVVSKFCGNRLSWCWYAAVCILSLLLAPDKEAALIFLVLGYYPILRPYFQKTKCSWLLKALLFNIVMIVMYVFLIRLIGLTEVTKELYVFGAVGALVLLLLGNVVFFMMDIVLGRLDKFR